MKKFVLVVFASLVCAVSVSAQNYMVVDSKKIFESLDEYTQALKTIDELGVSYQSQVDAKFDEVEALYNSYMQRANSLNSVERSVYETKITNMEAEATEYQESIFAHDGVLIKKRLELLSPIQNRVFKAIETYAKSRSYDLVLDESTSTTVLYKSSGVDHTAGVIEELKK
ncbi:MAG: OmpH family outer membrane protein [Rikenellaceae bacterium]